MSKYCETCGMIHDVIIKEEERTYKVKDIEITENLYITYCNVCQNEVYNKEMELKNDIIMFNAYKKAKNLLTSEEIKKLKEELEWVNQFMTKY